MEDRMCTDKVIRVYRRDPTLSVVVTQGGVFVSKEAFGKTFFEPIDRVLDQVYEIGDFRPSPEEEKWIVLIRDTAMEDYDRLVVMNEDEFQESRIVAKAADNIMITIRGEAMTLATDLWAGKVEPGMDRILLDKRAMRALMTAVRNRINREYGRL